MEKEKIDLSEFKRWMNDRVTKSVFQALKDYRLELDVALLEGDVIMSSEKEAIKIIGRREGLDMVLNISSDDIIGEDDGI